MTGPLARLPVKGIQAARSPCSAAAQGEHFSTAVAPEANCSHCLPKGAFSRKHERPGAGAQNIFQGWFSPAQIMDRLLWSASQSQNVCCQNLNLSFSLVLICYLVKEKIWKNVEMLQYKLLFDVWRYQLLKRTNKKKKKFCGLKPHDWFYEDFMRLTDFSLTKKAKINQPFLWLIDIKKKFLIIFYRQKLLSIIFDNKFTLVLKAF